MCVGREGEEEDEERRRVEARTNRRDSTFNLFFVHDGKVVRYRCDSPVAWMVTSLSQNQVVTSFTTPASTGCGGRLQTGGRVVSWMDSQDGRGASATQRTRAGCKRTTRRLMMLFLTPADDN